MSLLKRPLPFIDYIVVIRKKLWMLAVIFALTLGSTAWVTLRQIPVYQSTCKIRYKRGIPATALNSGFLQYFLTPYFDSTTFATERYIIKSKPIAGGVVETLGLASPENPPAWQSWIRRVQAALDVDKIKDTTIYAITARYREPDLAQAIANTAAAVYIDLSLKEKKESAQKTLTLLTVQIGNLEQRIKQSQLALLNYVETEGVPELESTEIDEVGTGIGSSQITLLNALRSRKVQLEIEREQYLNKYKDKHPRVKETERQIEVLGEKINNENRRIVQTHKKAIEYRILQKEVEANQELYNILIKKLKELDISDAGIESNIEIVERAERPSRPIAPQKKRNLTLGGLFGLLIGLSAVFVTEYFDPTLQTPEEVEAFLNLPVLASIPRMAPPGGMTEKEAKDFLFKITVHSPRSHETEMFKQLRTNIRFSDFGAESICLLVTSSSPREGKTTVSSNLAITMAHAGVRTVLIDTDMRRPALAEVFDIPKGGKGISEYLKGEAGLDEIILPTAFDNLWIIPSGGIPSNPSELLESPRLRESIEQLKTKFDRVVFDSPPIGGLADASIIGALVDGVILVCFAGHIEKNFILRTKQQLEKGGAKIYGVVLNYIELKLRSYYYYYHSVYKYGYR